MEKPERSVYTPQDFAEWHENGVLDLTPKFQRRGVWTPAARSFFIDSLLRSMPVPPIYIRLTQASDRQRVLRQVIDGQQRISCVLDFMAGKFRLSGAMSPEWAGKTFQHLSAEEQRRISEYSFSTEIFRGISDSQVLEIFSRPKPRVRTAIVRQVRHMALIKNAVTRPLSFLPLNDVHMSST